MNIADAVARFTLFVSCQVLKDKLLLKDALFRELYRRLEFRPTVNGAGFLESIRLTKPEIDLALEQLTQCGGDKYGHYTSDRIQTALSNKTAAWGITTAPIDADYSHVLELKKIKIEFPGKDLEARLVFSDDSTRFLNYQLPRYRSFIGFSREVSQEKALTFLDRNSVTLDDLGIQ